MAKCNQLTSLPFKGLSNRQMLRLQVRVDYVFDYVSGNSPVFCLYLNKCRKFDIMDTMLHKLEKYADNLESIVQQRTGELIEEKQKTDMLINRMLPP